MLPSSVNRKRNLTWLAKVMLFLPRPVNSLPGTRAKCQRKFCSSATGDSLYWGTAAGLRLRCDSCPNSPGTRLQPPKPPELCVRGASAHQTPSLLLGLERGSERRSAVQQPHATSV